MTDLVKAVSNVETEKRRGARPRYDAQWRRIIALLYEVGATPVQLGRRFHIDRATVLRYVHEQGLPVRREGRPCTSKPKENQR